QTKPKSGTEYDTWKYVRDSWKRQEMSDIRYHSNDLIEPTRPLRIKPCSM
ncbi:hypothetical protein L9F63_023246, partial [Diploptera punctata]